MRLLLFVIVLLVPLAARAQELTVFAAASLTDAMQDVSALWTKAGHPAAAPVVRRQLDPGAADRGRARRPTLFASADEKWMDYLAQKNLIAADTRKDLLGNDLVLVVPADKPLHVTIGPGFDLLGLLGANGRLATGDPAHVPVGIYAEQALKKLGWWDKIAPRLARTADVRAALLLVERGEAPAGIVYATDAAVSKAVMVAGTFPAEQPRSGRRIRSPWSRRGDTPEARALLTFLAGPQARAVFVQRGFKVE